jgi:hypothetical protein
LIDKKVPPPRLKRPRAVWKYTDDIKELTNVRLTKRNGESVKEETNFDSEGSVDDDS